MPKSAILKSTGLFSDVAALSNEWEQSDLDAYERKLKLEKQSNVNADKNGNDTNVDSQNNNDNNSQE